MHLYRIAKTKHVRDLSGAGPRLYGGRWNHRGTAVIYTAESRALATVEYLVHVPLPYEPLHLSLVTLLVPDDTPQLEISPDELPRGWKMYPAPPALADLGSEWARDNETLLLRVPSAVVEAEYNVLVNPGHSHMSRVRIVDVTQYTFDQRLLKRS
jgi:RES domain-containing protein